MGGVADVCRCISRTRLLHRDGVMDGVDEIQELRLAFHHLQVLNKTVLDRLGVLQSENETLKRKVQICEDALKASAKLEDFMREKLKGRE